MYNSEISYAGDAVVNVYINHEKKFAFVEMRTVEEASNAMALDGIIFEACHFKLSILVFSYVKIMLLSNYYHMGLSNIEWLAS